eukprot:2016324-Rhodomonas_salina.1
MESWTVFPSNREGLVDARAKSKKFTPNIASSFEKNSTLTWKSGEFTLIRRLVAPSSSKYTLLGVRPCAMRHHTISHRTCWR